MPKTKPLTSDQWYENGLLRQGCCIPNETTMDKCGVTLKRRLAEGNHNILTETSSHATCPPGISQVKNLGLKPGLHVRR